MISEKLVTASAVVVGVAPVNAPKNPTSPAGATPLYVGSIPAASVVAYVLKAVSIESAVSEADVLEVKADAKEEANATFATSAVVESGITATE